MELMTEPEFLEYLISPEGYGLSKSEHIKKAVKNRLDMLNEQDRNLQKAFSSCDRVPRDEHQPQRVQAGVSEKAGGISEKDS